MVPAAAEFSIPVAGELIVREFSRLSDDKRNRGSAWSGGSGIRGQRKQVSAGSRTELVALDVQDIEGHRVDGRAGIAIRRHQPSGLPCLDSNLRNADRLV